MSSHAPPGSAPWSLTETLVYWNHGGPQFDIFQGTRVYVACREVDASYFQRVGWLKNSHGSLGRVMDYFTCLSWISSNHLYLYYWRLVDWTRSESHCLSGTSFGFDSTTKIYSCCWCWDPSWGTTCLTTEFPQQTGPWSVGLAQSLAIAGGDSVWLDYCVLAGS